MKVLSVNSSFSTGRVLCDGAEVLDAGGSDEERIAYACAEAADLLASIVDDAKQYPAQVAMLPLRLSWLEGGGQRCSHRDELVEATLRRLATLKPEWRLECRTREGGVIVVREEEVTEDSQVSE